MCTCIETQGKGKHNTDNTYTNTQGRESLYLCGLPGAAAVAHKVNNSLPLLLLLLLLLPGTSLLA
jgi:hypothetical protein